MCIPHSIRQCKVQGLMQPICVSVGCIINKTSLVVRVYSSEQPYLLTKLSFYFHVNEQSEKLTDG